MGAQQSNPKDDEDIIKSQRKIRDENRLLEERIKNQVLQHKLKILQTQNDKNRQENVFGNISPNQLLTNPQLQKEFMRNKQMQRQFIELLQKQKKMDINQDNYQQINTFLKKLEIKEDEVDERKPYLYMNESSQKYNVREGEEKKLNIGNSISDREKYIRQIKRQKEEQEKNMLEQQKKRKEEYMNKLNGLEEDNIDPYKILEIPKNASIDQMKAAFKRKAKIYHPDRVGGNTHQFQLITKALMKLVEEHKKKQADKQFMTLKEESSEAMKKQRNQNKKNVKIDMAGNNFNPKKFNKIFKDNRLYNPNDEGYNNWMTEADYDALKTPKILEGQYNKQSFNETFQNHKKKTSKELVKHVQPQALTSYDENCEELGQGNISDYSGRIKKGKGGIEYTDYKKAHTETNLIDVDEINVREYNDLDDLERERSKKLFLTPQEYERIKMDEMLEKQKEEDRKNRLTTNDESAFKQFEKVNQMFLH
jgi:curved DNA-binding protein CbpA